jgi:hypothetical protein
VANVVVVLVGALMVVAIVSVIRRHRVSLVSRRGTSIGADLGTLGDQPRVRIREAVPDGAERVRVVLAPESGQDLDLVVSLTDPDFGLDLLQRWARAGTVLAIVIPPGSHLVRLRSIEDQQPITLRRLDAG